MERTPRIWDRENHLAFLAWLDYSVASGLHFTSTAPSAIQTITGQIFSEAQINSRVQRVTRNSRRRGHSLQSSDLRKGGSSTLHLLDEQMRQEIGAMVETFREQQDGSRMDRTNPKAENIRVKGSIDDTLPDDDGSDLSSEDDSHYSDMRKESPSRPSLSMVSVEIPASSAVTTLPRAQTAKTNSDNLVAATAKGSLSLKDMRKMHEEVVSRLKAENAAVRAQTQQDLEDQSQEANRWKQIAENLSAKVSFMKTAHQERQLARKDPQEELMFTKDKQIWRLTQENHKLRHSTSFSKKINPQEESLENLKVWNEVDLLQRELISIMHGHDSSAPLLQPEFGVGLDLALLLRAMFREASYEAESSGHLVKRMMRWGPVNVVRSLAVAALNEWVFATDFPNFCGASTSPPLLKAYRNAIFMHDGWTSLHNLEMAAYNSLIDSNDFIKITVPRKADELASRLSKALAPLFLRSSDVESNATFEQWNQQKNICEDRRYRMKELFEAALRLKSAAVMTDERYEFVVYPPGSSVTESGAYSAPDFESQDDSGCWLQATLYTYASELSDPTDHLADALVQPNNFISNRYKKAAREQHLTEKQLKILKLGDVSMDFSWGAGQDRVDADEVDRWTHRDGGEEIAWRNEGQSPKRPMQQQTHHHTRKRRRTQSSVASTPETAESDYREGENCSPVERKQRGGKIPKTPRSAPPGSCPKCGAAYSNRGSLQEHIRLDECVLCEQCNTYVKNMTVLKQHQLEEHSDVTGILRNGFSENGSLADNDGIEDNDQSGVQDTNEDGFDQRSTPHRKRNLTITISDKSVKEIAMKPSCQYCRKSFTPHNLGRHLKNMSCTQHRDAKPDAAKKLGKKRQNTAEPLKSTCGFCGEFFNDKRSRSHHLHNMSCDEHREIKSDRLKELRYRQNSKEMSNGKTVCGMCGTSFTAQNYGRHVDFHCTGNPCSVCDDIFFTAITLRDHMLHVHGLVPEPTLTCKNCKQEFPTANSLKNHLTIKPCSKCEQCGEWFQTRNALSAHQRDHLPPFTPQLVSGKGLRGRNSDPQTTTSDLSSPAGSDMEDELSGMNQSSPEILPRQPKKSGDIPEEERSERSRNQRFSLTISTNKTHSRAPLRPGRDLVGLSGSSSSPQPVYASLTPQDSSQQTRKATSAKQSQREASEDELTIPDSQPRRATMTQDTFFDTTEVRNAVEEDDDEEVSMVILRGGKGKKKAFIELNTKIKSATFGY
ncbi:hypothetical protein WAI453_005514 [Rhynchosporium graminicola]